MTVPWPLQQASYNGIPFFVEAQSRASGRRTVTKEVPKSDTLSTTEDMGRRIRKFAVTAYIIYSPVLDPDWQTHRNDLWAACEADGTGTLVLPTMLSDDVASVIVDTYSVTEYQEKGGYAEFTINFIEAGQLQATAGTDAQATATGAADNGAANTTNSSDVQDVWANPQAPSTSNISANPGITPSDNGIVANDFSALPTQITPSVGDAAPVNITITDAHGNVFAP